MTEETEITQGVLPLESTDTEAELDSEEYEVITSEEVDRVLLSLEELMNSVESDNIRCLLEEASETIFGLIYTEDDLEYEEEEAA